MTEYIDWGVELVGAILSGWGMIGFMVVLMGAAIVVGLLRGAAVLILAPIGGAVRLMSRGYAIAVRRAGTPDIQCTARRGMAFNEFLDWLAGPGGWVEVGRCGYGSGHAGLCGGWIDPPPATPAEPA
ncbi:hypothetical protein ACFXGT_20220 [Streptomyces sp. NPDC059352]|uniref:hypothetical protein n=1 Tax=Streptomyces sp. NPDC059352 TaxID=3346810 RepID=UPI00369195B8